MTSTTPQPEAPVVGVGATMGEAREDHARNATAHDGSHAYCGPCTVARMTAACHANMRARGLEPGAPRPVLAIPGCDR